MINKVILLGNLGKDPEIRIVSNNKKVANFSIATNDQKDAAIWHNIVMWDKLADVAERYLKKGTTVYLEGRIVYRNHENKNYTDIVCHTMKMIGGKVRGNNEQNSEAESDDLPW